MSLRPRQLPTPLLSRQERALLLSLLSFTPAHAVDLLARVAGKAGERLRRSHSALAGADPRALVIELRRLVDSRFEGAERLHDSWLTDPLEAESPEVCAAWRAELPAPLRGPNPSRPAPRVAVAHLRARFLGPLAELAPDPPSLTRTRLSDTSPETLLRLVHELSPERTGRALGDLGEESAQRIAQQLPLELGRRLLSAWAEGYEEAAHFALLRAARRLGVSIEDAP